MSTALCSLRPQLGNNGGNRGNSKVLIICTILRFSLGRNDCDCWVHLLNFTCKQYKIIFLPFRRFPHQLAKRPPSPTRSRPPPLSTRLPALVATDNCPTADAASRRDLAIWTRTGCGADVVTTWTMDTSFRRPFRTCERRRGRRCGPQLRREQED